MGECKLIKRVSCSEDGEKKFTNFYLKFNGVDRLIPITQTFTKQKADFILLCNLAEKESN